MSTPEGAQLLHKCHTGVTDRWSDDYLDMLGQQHRVTRTDWPMEQVYCFGQLHIDLEAGLIGRVPLTVAGTPHPDRQREANAAVLADLPEPFRAEVNLTQHGGDQDGWLIWDRPIEVDVATGETVTDPDGAVRAILAGRPIPPGMVPLEIGTTLPSRTLLHVRSEAGVARWPYGSKLVWLLVNLSRIQPLDHLPEDFVPATLAND